MLRTIIILIIIIAAGSVTARAAAQPVATEQTSGTTALLIGVSVVDENIVWVSGTAGTWLRTTDGGTTWRAGQVPGADSLQFRDVHAVDANTAYLLSIGEGSQSRIYHTADGGRTWSLQFTNPDAQGFYDCFDFWDARRGIVIGDVFDWAAAILATTDGVRWTRMPRDVVPVAPDGEGSFAASGTCLITRPGGRAWAVASNAERGRILHTADHGRSWSTFPLPLTTRAGAGPQSVTFRDDMNGMVLGGGNSARTGDVLVAVTADGGSTWTPRTAPPLQRGVWGGMYVPGTDPPIVVAVGPDGAVYSRDEGRTWTVIDTNNHWSLGFASPRAGWLVGARGRITKLSEFR
jgi:photosystem II stability/assembly factor-like uncharacterized protein